MGLRRLFLFGLTGDSSNIDPIDCLQNGQSENSDKEAGQKTREEPKEGLKKGITCRIIHQDAI